MENGRNLYLDVLKGLLIFLVVWGHTIQFIWYENDFLFFSDPIFQFIYMFHMPLFLGVSGFLSFRSTHKYDYREFIRRRFSTLFLPMLVWCILFTILIVVLKKDTSLLTIVSNFIFYVFHNYWFIWAVLLYSSIISILAKYKLDNIFVFILLSLLSMSIPSSNTLFTILNSMFLFYVLGYCFAQLKVKDKLLLLFRKTTSFLLFFLLSLILFIYWKSDFYVYITNSNWENLYVTFYRLMSGVVLSIFVIICSYFIYKRLLTKSIIEFISKMGRHSLDIYLIQQILFSGIILDIFALAHLKFNSFWIVNDWLDSSYSLFLAIFLLYIFGLFLKLVSKNKKLLWILFRRKE